MIALRTLALVITLSVSGVFRARSAEQKVPVWIVGNGFHTSLALRTADVPYAADLGLTRRDRFVVIGWGAGDFYRGRVNVGTTFAAIFGLSQSVLHVVPVQGDLANRFSHSDLVRLDLTPAELTKLTAFLDRSFRRDAHGKRIPAGHGYYVDSRFYEGTERFYFPKMCNVWVAEKLHRSGVHILPAGALTAGDILREADQIGHREQFRSQPADAF